MKVALFTDSDAFAGTERHMLELADGLVGDGLRPAVVCPSPSPLAQRAERAGHRVIEIQKRGALDWRAVRALRRLLRDGELDVLHAHNGRTHLLAAAAVTAAGRGAVVATQHFISPERVNRRGVKGMMARFLHRWASRRTGGLIAISNSVASAIVERADFPPDRMAVVPNGIASPDLSLLAAPAAVRAELGLGPEAPLLVCAARLEVEKDVDVLIDAMQHVTRVHPGALCIIAGDGSQRGELESQIRSAGLSNSVRLLGHRSDVMALVRAADVFVLPSRAEPFGLVLLEAMALARPVIATAAGGPAEIIIDAQTGLLVPPRDAVALADAIHRLLSDPPLRERLSQAGRSRYESCYTAGRMSQATAAVYRRAFELARGQSGSTARALVKKEEPCASC